MITNLHLKNFTAFTELTIDFSPGINIVISVIGFCKMGVCMTREKVK